MTTATCMIRTPLNCSVTAWKGISIEKSEPERNLFAHRTSLKDGWNGLQTISQKVNFFFFLDTVLVSLTCCI